MPTAADILSGGLGSDAEIEPTPAEARRKSLLADAVYNIADPFQLRRAAPSAADVLSGALGATGSAVVGAGALAFEDPEDGWLGSVGRAIQGRGEELQAWVSADPARDYAGRTILQALGSTAPILGVSFANPGLALGFSGLMSAGEAAERARGQGLSRGKVAAAALAGGVTGAMIERLSGAPLRVASRLSGQVTKPGLSGALQFVERVWDRGALLKESLGEGVEEALQGWTQDVIQWAYDPDQDVFSYDAAVRRLQEFGIGAAAGGLLSGLSSAGNAALAARTEARLAEGGQVRPRATPAFLSDEDAAALGGRNDPDAVVPSSRNRAGFAKVTGPVVDEESGGFYYHATSEDRARDIGNLGELRTHNPGDFTDQDSWPDGGTEPRAYFTSSPDHTWQFAPEDGKPVLLRVPRSETGAKVESGTGDIFSRSPVPGRYIEYLGEDQKWHPLSPDVGELEAPASFSPSAEETTPELQFRGGMDDEVDLPTSPTIRDIATANDRARPLTLAEVMQAFGQDAIAEKKARARGEDPTKRPRFEDELTRQEKLDEARAEQVQRLKANTVPRKDLTHRVGTEFPHRKTPQILEGMPNAEALYHWGADLWDHYAYFWQRGPRFFEMLQGWKPDGEWTRTFWNRYVNGFYNYKKILALDDGEFKTFVDSHNDPAWLSRMADSDWTLPSGIRVNGAEFAMIPMAAKDFLAGEVLLEDGFKRPDGTPVGRLTAEDVAWAIENQRPEHLEFAQYLRKYLDRKHYPLAAVVERLQGRVLPFVDDYFPVLRDHELSRDTMNEFVSSLQSIGMENVADKLGKGMTRARGEKSRGPIILDGLAVLEAYKGTANYFIAQAENIDDFRALASDPEVVRLLQEGFGVGPRRVGSKLESPVDAVQQLQGWIEAISRPGPVLQGGRFWSGIRWLRTHGAVGVLGLKVGIGLKQAISTSIAIAEYGDAPAITHGWIKLIKAISSEGSLLNNSVIKEAERLAPDIFHRTIERELVEFKADASGRRARSPLARKLQVFDTRAMDLAMKIITTIDKLTVAAVFHGVYDAEYAKKKSHVQAVATARRINMVTQPQSTIGDLSPFMRSPGELMKVWSVFSNQISQNLNMDRAFYHKWQNGDVGNDDAIIYAIFRFLVPAIVMAILDQGLKPDAKDFATNLLKQPTGGFPVVGSMINSALYNVDNFHRDMQTATIGDIVMPKPLAGAGAAKAIGGTVGAFNKLQKGEPPTLRQVMDIVGGMGSQVGLPGDAARTIVAAGEEFYKNPSMSTAEFLRALVFSPYQRRRGWYGKEPETKGGGKVDPFDPMKGFWSEMDKATNAAELLSRVGE